MAERIEVGDLVRFAHMKEPAGRITRAERNSSFHGSQLVEIEGWVGEFSTSGLIVVEKAKKTGAGMTECRAETLIGRRIVACGQLMGHTGSHGWEGLNLADIQSMIQANGLAEDDVLVIAHQK